MKRFILFLSSVLCFLPLSAKEIAFDGAVPVIQVDADGSIKIEINNDYDFSFYKISCEGNVKTEKLPGLTKRDLSDNTDETLEFYEAECSRDEKMMQIINEVKQKLKEKLTVKLPEGILEKSVYGYAVFYERNKDKAVCILNLEDGDYVYNSRLIELSGNRVKIRDLKKRVRFCSKSDSGKEIVIYENFKKYRTCITALNDLLPGREKFRIITHKEELPYFQCEVSYPDFKKYPSMGRFFRSKYEAEINKMKPEAEEFYDELAEYGMGPAGYSYEVFMTSDFYTDDRIINFFMSNYSFTGGAHGFRWLESYWFDKKKKRFMSQEEKLEYTGITEEKLSEAVRRELTDPESGDYDMWKKKLDSSDENWLLSGTEPDSHCFDAVFYNGKKNEITVFIPPYQIGPYAVGSFFVTLPIEKIKAVK